MNDVKISYSASFARIESAPPEVIERIKTQLTYEDSTISYQNKFSKFYRDPYKCLLKGRSFYTGLLPRVDWIVRSCGCTGNYTKLHNTVHPSSVELPDWLYNHQVDMIRLALESSRCILQSPTGSGKTITMAYILKHFPHQSVLVTVPSKDLLAQTVGVLEKTLQEEVGVIGAGKQKWKRVTVGIINSLYKLAKVEKDKFKHIEILICDEVHRVGDNFYIDLCEALVNTDFRLGFSATAWREKGDSKVMEGLIGPVALSIKEDFLVQEGILVHPKYCAVPIKSPQLRYPKYQSYNNSYATSNGKPDRQLVYENCIVRNRERNKLIVSIAQEYLSKNPKLPLLILVELIEHGEILQKLFKDKGEEVSFVHGSTPKKQRQQFLEDLKERRIKIGIASKILNEGQDIPALGVGIIAGGGGSETKFIQQVGRFVRRHPLKSTAVIIDFNDSEPFYLNTNYRARLKSMEYHYQNSYAGSDYRTMLKELPYESDSTV